VHLEADDLAAEQVEDEVEGRASVVI